MKNLALASHTISQDKDEVMQSTERRPFNALHLRINETTKTPLEETFQCINTRVHTTILQAGLREGEQPLLAASDATRRCINGVYGHTFWHSFPLFLHRKQRKGV